MKKERKSRCDTRVRAEFSTQLKWVDESGAWNHVEARGVDVSKSGACVVAREPIQTGASIHVDAPKFNVRGAGNVRYCTRKGNLYSIGIQFSPEAASSIDAPPPPLTDYHEVLQNAPLPVPVALSRALQLVDGLRIDHDSGHFYGTLDPAEILFPESGPAFLSAADSPAVYAAPEVLEGRSADMRSDVFVFASLLYHLLTGRHPFAGQDAAETRRAVIEGQPAVIESLFEDGGPVPAGEYAGLVRLVMSCLSKNPGVRVQRMQLVYLELRLQVVSARRSGAALAARRVGTVLREEIGRVEQALTAGLEERYLSLVELQHAAGEMQQRIQSVVEAQEALRSEIRQLEKGVAAVGETATHVESDLAEATRPTTAVEEALLAQIAVLEQQIQSQDQSIDALQTAVSQSEDLLERVVEALGSLESFVLEHSDDNGATVDSPIGVGFGEGEDWVPIDAGHCGEPQSVNS